MGKFSFRKTERLKKEKDIQELFEKGSYFYLFPFKVLYLKGNEPQNVSHRVLTSVSKRNFKKAVDRNLLKRRMREAYRKHKVALPELPKLMIGLVYTHKELIAFQEIELKVEQIIKKLKKLTE